MIKKVIASLSVFLPFVFWFAGATNAEGINLSITGNGDSSQSQVVVNVDQNQSVQQSNQADIQNNVDSQANTGNNNASGNNGSEVNIETGDVNSSTDINNENINQNVAETECCPVQTDLTIKNNGSDSINSITSEIFNNVEINQTNYANIVNNAITNANTGQNLANSNNGNVTIATGNITAVTNIENKNININDDPQAVGGQISIFVGGNGTNSENYVNYLFQNNINVNEANYANILNNAVMNLNTGCNVADKNVGSVFISTGDILGLITIKNEDINKSDAEISNCCEKDEDDKDKDDDNGKPDEPILPPPPPPGPPGPDDKPGPSIGRGGEGNGAVAGEAAGLPETGNFLTLFGIILALMFFFAGVYLRFSSGVSPPAIA